MSNRRFVTDHLLVRWLERAEGMDMRMVRDAMARDGIIGGNDSDLVHFVGCHLGVDIEGIRRELMAVIAPAVAVGARRVKYKGFSISLSETNGVTVYDRRVKRSRNLDYSSWAKRRRAMA
jgi:hypothetical protein